MLWCHAEPVGERVTAVESSEEEFGLGVCEFGGELIDVVAFLPVSEVYPDQHKHSRWELALRIMPGRERMSGLLPLPAAPIAHPFEVLAGESLEFLLALSPLSVGICTLS